MRRTRLPRIALASAVSVGGSSVDLASRPACPDVDVTRLSGRGRWGKHGPGGAGALSNCWPSRVGRTPASRVRCAGLRPLLTPAQPAHPWVGAGGRFAGLKMGVVQDLWLERAGEHVYDTGRVRRAGDGHKQP